MNQSIDDPLISAHEAARRLGVKRDTLYAYVSRGRLRSVAVAGSRERRYRAEDVAALRAARGAGKAAPQPDTPALLPVLDSAICLIEDGRLYYRGHDAVRLSDTATLEDIADLLWNEPDDRAEIEGPHTPVPAPSPALAGGRGGGRDPDQRVRGGGHGHGNLTGIIEGCQARLAELATSDSIGVERSRSVVARVGRVILSELIGCIAGDGDNPMPAHRRLAAHWGLDEAGADLVRRCLVLLAEHELNASTFVARCVASTGARPYAVVTAALAALLGPRHGGAAPRVEAMFHDLKASGADPIAAMAARLAGGDRVPGVGHPLYPDGDPRAVAILYAVSIRLPQVRRFVGWRPNVDFALAAATTALGLPCGAALALFVVARTVGWIAHAIEQYDSGTLIRPRAHYIGPRPSA
jgi:citrate synthase